MADIGLTIPVLLQTRDERRRAERFAASMPVSIDGREGTTQDLSTTGLSFHAMRDYAPGTRLEVVIEYLLDGHSYPLQCQAEVVRSVPEAEGFTIGARLLPDARITTVPLGEVDVTLRPLLRSVD